VSNFGIGHLEKLASSASITPAVNQIELHPWLQWRELVTHCKGKGIVLEVMSATML
jgi:diketogulonate reductase-like aldo/keto reductase